MNPLTVARCSALAAALLAAGCAGKQSSLLANPELQNLSVTTTQTDNAVGSKSKTNDLVYVSDDGAIDFYNFPKVKKPVGSISATTRGLCSDKEGSVWATVELEAYTFEMVEYPHGGTTPIAQLPAGPAIPYGCAVDQKTGNLAVTSFPKFGSQHGYVAIYRKAKGTPRIYSDPNIDRYYACAYDDRSNLLVQGYESGSDDVAYADLAKGSRKLQDVSLEQLGGVPGGVQWDGSYFVVGLRDNGTIYRIAVANGKGSVVGQTQLDRAQSQGGIDQFWIQGDRVVATTGNEDAHWMAVYPYPQGEPRSHHHLIAPEPLGLTVSAGSGSP
jgi:hypothetical protein